MNSSFSRAVAWMIWIVASVFYAYQYILRVMPNILMNDIMQHFSIDAATFGQFSGLYYIGYSLMHLPVGILLDRYGPKKIMSGSILLTILGLTPLIFANHWLMPLLGRCLIGIGSSAAILGVFKIIRMAFREEKFPRMLSISVMIGLIGAIYGGGPVNYMLQKFGYEMVVSFFALLGVLLAIVTFWLVPNIQTQTKSSVKNEIKEVISNPKVIGTCLFAGLMVGPLEGFADVWGTAFLKQSGFDSTSSASMPSIIFIAMCFGAPLLNLIAERLKNYLLTIAAAGIIMAIGFILLLKLQANTSLISCNFAIIGVCSAYQILAIYKASSYVPSERAALTSALANMIIMIFGYVFHTTIGNIVSLFGGPTSLKALHYGIGVIPIGLFLGSLGFSFLWLTERKKEIQKRA